MYTLRLSSPRITPANSLPDPDLDTETSNSRKSTIKRQRRTIKKLGFSFVAIGVAITIAALIAVGFLLPTLEKSKSSTEESDLNGSVGSFVVSSFLITHTSTDTTTTTSANTTITTTPYFFRWNITGETVVGITNISSNSSDRLDGPTRIFIDSSDILYIADSNNNRIQAYVINTTVITTVAGSSGGTASNLMNRLNYPTDVHVDSTCNMYIVDSNNHRVQLWNASATTGTRIIGTGTVGNGANQLNAPRAVTINPNTGIVYIVDKDNHRIFSYSPLTSALNIIAGGNGAGLSSTKLHTPAGVAFESSTNSLIIANYGANNVVRWPIGATSWSLVTGNTNGTRGGTATTLYGPYDVTIDSTGNLYIADTLNHRIQFFPVGSNTGTTIAGMTAVPGSTAILLKNPVSIALDSQFNLYVSDKDNHRIQRFKRY